VCQNGASFLEISPANKIKLSSKRFSFAVAQKKLKPPQDTVGPAAPALAPAPVKNRKKRYAYA